MFSLGQEQYPDQGVSLLQIIDIPQAYFTLALAWSPDGKTLASAGDDRIVRLWHPGSGQLQQTLEGHSDWTRSLAWSPDGKTLASAGDDRMVRLWDPGSGQLRRTLESNSNRIHSLAWSPDGKTLVSAGDDTTIRFWDPGSGRLQQTLEGHSELVRSLAWSPDGKTLASAGDDRMVRLWNTERGVQEVQIERHTDSVYRVSFSFDGRLLVSSSADSTARIWRTNDWEEVAPLSAPLHRNYRDALDLFTPGGFVFHPTAPILAGVPSTAGKTPSSDEESYFEASITLWEYDPVQLRRGKSRQQNHQYSNAKIVVVGDSGVGKSGLGLVLCGEPFAPTESTHGRHIRVFDLSDGSLPDGSTETHEIFLWDLAGQPGYRLIHQLNLSDVTVALVVFDARNDTDPFAGVRYWDRALRQARLAQGMKGSPLRKFLVAARSDRGTIGVSPERINHFMRNLNFDGFFETSAKEGWQIAELRRAVHNTIEWAMLPRIRSTEFLRRIRRFLTDRQLVGNPLTESSQLYVEFLQTEGIQEGSQELRDQFETGIILLQSRGLIRRLSFGDLILLQPERLDAYASALVDAAKAEPDGLGTIAEEVALSGRFRVPGDERIGNSEQEKLLLLAMVEDLLRHEIALREYVDGVAYLVFPSQLTRERPDLPEPQGKAVVFSYSGAVLNVYATLAVRLSHSGFFSKDELWKNAATFIAGVGGTCGIYVRELEEGRGELTLFFAPKASTEVRARFEDYVRVHLDRSAIPGSVSRRRIVVCSSCATPIGDLVARARWDRGFTWIPCPVCSDPDSDHITRISLIGVEERVTAAEGAIVREMDRAADSQRNIETTATILAGKVATGNYDVFLCHNSKDRSAVKEIGQLLRERGILPWLDEWELQPGLPWQPKLEQQIRKIKSAAVFVGNSGAGPWQNLELAAFLRAFLKRKCPVIPVILQDYKRLKHPSLPPFLEGMTWVDFRQREPDPMERLIWGITGIPPKNALMEREGDRRK